MESLIGKNIRVVMKNGFHYDAKVLDENEQNYHLLDRLGKKVIIAKDSILTLEVSI